MNKHFWDGEMDYEWEDLSDFLIKISKEFTETMLKTASYSGSSKIKELISEECMERFEKIAGILSETISDGIYYQTDDDNSIQSGQKLNCWILLGSLTETSLQLFISIYLDDYEKTKWQIWNDFDADIIKTSIIESIQELVDTGKLKPEYGKSLKEAIKSTIKEHTKEHKIQKVMLDELIQLYISLELLDEDEIFYLRTIQSNRNGIHSFESRRIGTWYDLQYCVRFFCYLLKWILYRLPDVPNEDCC